jgi:predicted small lipoprotein YifL
MVSSFQPLAAIFAPLFNKPLTMMMKKAINTLLALAVVAVLLPGCGFSGMYGALYSDVTTPVEATANGVGSKVGTSEVTSILGLVATGDAGINEAAKNGGISKISHVDMHVMSILGLYAKYTVYVYGE